MFWVHTLYVCMYVCMYVVQRIFCGVVIWHYMVTLRDGSFEFKQQTCDLLKKKYQSFLEA